MLNIWDLEFKVLSITTDNAANVKKAIRDLRVRTYVSCATHTLQLSIIKGLDEIKDIIEKCKNLIRFLVGDKKRQQLKETQLYLQQ